VGGEVEGEVGRAESSDQNSKTAVTSVCENKANCPRKRKGLGPRNHITYLSGLKRIKTSPDLREVLILMGDGEQRMSACGKKLTYILCQETEWGTKRSSGSELTTPSRRREVDKCRKGFRKRSR